MFAGELCVGQEMSKEVKREKCCPPLQCQAAHLCEVIQHYSTSIKTYFAALAAAAAAAADFWVGT